MKRFEIYIDSKERLSLVIFDSINSEYESEIIRGAQTYDYIKKLSEGKILDLYTYKDRNDVVIRYNNYIIGLNDCSTLLKKRGMGPLIKSLKEYQEHKSLKKNCSFSNEYNSFNNNLVDNKVEAYNQNKRKTKHVKRKNKYTGRIIAGALVVYILLGGVLIAQKKDTNLNDDIQSEETIKQIDGTEKIWIDPSIEEESTLDTTEIEEKSTLGTTEIEEDSYLYSTPIEENSVFKNFNISINYNDRSSLEKVYITKAYYGELIEKYAIQYGLDPNLVLAIATQERGIHSREKDSGGATGLMQLQNSVWEGKYISAHNFSTGKRESLYVTKDLISDVHSNIRIGCMYLQNCMEYMNYNVIAAVQCYNMGHRNMMDILKAYSFDVNKSVEEILNDKQDIGWLEYRNIIAVGDENYIENVFSWLGENIELNNTTTSNDLVVCNISSNSSVKKVY